MSVAAAFNPPPAPVHNQIQPSVCSVAETTAECCNADLPSSWTIDVNLSHSPILHCASFRGTWASMILVSGRRTRGAQHCPHADQASMHGFSPSAVNSDLGTQPMGPVVMHSSTTRPCRRSWTEDHTPYGVQCTYNVGYLGPTLHYSHSSDTVLRNDCLLHRGTVPLPRLSPHCALPCIVLYSYQIL